MIAISYMIYNRISRLTVNVGSVKYFALTMRKFARDSSLSLSPKKGRSLPLTILILQTLCPGTLELLQEYRRTSLSMSKMSQRSSICDDCIRVTLYLNQYLQNIKNMQDLHVSLARFILRSSYDTEAVRFIIPILNLVNIVCSSILRLLTLLTNPK
jgi:hypothetical protein